MEENSSFLWLLIPLKGNTPLSLPPRIKSRRNLRPPTSPIKPKAAIPTSSNPCATVRKMMPIRPPCYPTKPTNPSRRNHHRRRRRRMPVQAPSGAPSPMASPISKREAPSRPQAPKPPAPLPYPPGSCARHVACAIHETDERAGWPWCQKPGSVAIRR